MSSIDDKLNEVLDIVPEVTEVTKVEKFMWVNRIFVWGIFQIAFAECFV